MRKIATLAEFDRVVSTLTPYQQRVLKIIESTVDSTADGWVICQAGFTEQWNANRASHGAMFRAVLQAGRVMEEAGVIVILPPRTQHDTYTYCSMRPWIAAEEKCK